MLKRTLLVAAVISAGGCTADLAVFHADGTKANGIPVPFVEPYVISGTYTYHSEGKLCIDVSFVRFEEVKAGYYYVQPETGLFADSEFTLKFGENGLPTEYTLNSESNAAEFLKSVTEFLTSTGLLVPDIPSDVETSAAGPTVPCNIVPEGLKVEKFADFVTRLNSSEAQSDD